MNVFVSGEFQDQAKRAKIELYPTLKEVIDIFERVPSAAALDKDRRINPVSGTEGESIYALDYGSLRFYLTKKGDDVLLLRLNALN